MISIIKNTSAHEIRWLKNISSATFINIKVVAVQTANAVAVGICLMAIENK